MYKTDHLTHKKGSSQ